MDVYTGTVAKHRSGNKKCQGGGAQMGAPARFIGERYRVLYFRTSACGAHLKNLGGESYGKAGFL